MHLILNRIGFSLLLIGAENFLQLCSKKGYIHHNPILSPIKVFVVVAISPLWSFYKHLIGKGGRPQGNLKDNTGHFICTSNCWGILHSQNLLHQDTSRGELLHCGAGSPGWGSWQRQQGAAGDCQVQLS